MKEKDENKLGIWVFGVGHSRATTGTGRAKLLDFGTWCGQVRHGRAAAGTAVPLQARAVPRY